MARAQFTTDLAALGDTRLKRQSPASETEPLTESPKSGGELFIADNRAEGEKEKNN